MPESQQLSKAAEQVLAAFQKAVPRVKPLLCFAPGRVNLLGAHLDYNGGDVLPVAVDQGVYVAAAMRSDARVSVCSLNEQARFDCDIDELASLAANRLGWAAYPIGVFLVMSKKVEMHQGVDLWFAGDVPIGAGLSSSAALELATAFALNELYQIGFDRVELARIAHQAENEYVGLDCGIMDQFASALAASGGALLLHCRDGSFEQVPIAADQVEILVMNSLKQRSLGETGFNDRVRECAGALRVLQEECGHRAFLCDYQQQDLESVAGKLDPVAHKRARHVILEMQRVQKGVQSLRSGDLSRFGEAVNASHRSTAVDYEVSCPELDVLTESASSLPTVFGSRLTGAGFGGCAIALVKPGCSSEVSEVVAESFRCRFGVEPAFYVLRSGLGMRRIS